MARKNRPTLKAQYSDYIDRVSPFDGNALIQKTEDDQVNQDVFDSLLNNTDSSDLINSPSAAINLDFSAFDLFRINSSGSGETNFVITINNLGTGQLARIAITKKTNDIYSFSSATLNQIENLDQIGTSLNFYIHNVNGTLIAESDLSISKSDALDEDDSDQLATSKAAFDLDVKKADKTQPDWIAIVAEVVTGYTITSDAFIKINDQGITSFKGTIEVQQTSGAVPTVSIGTIEASEKPDRIIKAIIAANKGSTIAEAEGVTISGVSGLITINSPGTPNTWIMQFDELTYFQNG